MSNLFLTYTTYVVYCSFMKKKSLKIGSLELAILGILNREDGLSVSRVQEQLKNSGQKLAYTTVMTVLVRLFNKGLVNRTKEGRQYLYSVTKAKDSSPSYIFEKVRTSLFGSKKLIPILNLLEAEDGLSHEEMKELKSAIDKKLRKK